MPAPVWRDVLDGGDGVAGVVALAELVSRHAPHLHH